MALDTDFDYDEDIKQLAIKLGLIVGMITLGSLIIIWGLLR